MKILVTGGVGFIDSNLVHYRKDSFLLQNVVQIKGKQLYLSQ